MEITRKTIIDYVKDQYDCYDQEEQALRIGILYGFIKSENFKDNVLEILREVTTKNNNQNLEGE